MKWPLYCYEMFHIMNADIMKAPPILLQLSKLKLEWIHLRLLGCMKLCALNNKISSSGQPGRKTMQVPCYFTQWLSKNYLASCSVQTTLHLTWVTSHITWFGIIGYPRSIKAMWVHCSSPTINKAGKTISRKYLYKGTNEHLHTDTSNNTKKPQKSTKREATLSWSLCNMGKA